MSSRYLESNFKKYSDRNILLTEVKWCLVFLKCQCIMSSLGENESVSCSVRSNYFRLPRLCSLPSYSVCRILQARRLEWLIIPFSRGSSCPRDPTWVSCITGGFFTSWATREAPFLDEFTKSRSSPFFLYSFDCHAESIASYHVCLVTIGLFLYYG